MTTDSPNQQIHVHIDKKQFHAPKSQMTGAELKQLGGVDQTHRLFKEMPGKDPDVPIGDGEVVTLKNGDRFFSLPVGRVGGSGSPRRSTSTRSSFTLRSPR